MSDTEKINEDTGQKERALRHWILPVALMVVLLGAPLLAYVLFPGAVVGWVVLGSYGVLTALLGFVDALTFRASWTFPCLTGIGFWVASKMYFPEGTWIYIPVLMLIAWVFGKAGEAIQTNVSGSETLPEEV